MKTMRKLACFTIVVISMSLSGCYGLLSKIRIVDVQQGNVVTRQMLDRVYVGMSKEQVRSALGDPVLRSTFLHNRWDYVYTMQKAMKARHEKRVTIYFNNSGHVRRIATNFPK